MKMNDIMMVTYGVCGVAAAIAPHELLNFKLSSMALILIYSTHIFWTAVAGKHAPDNSVADAK